MQWKIALNAANNSPRCGAKTRHDGHSCQSPAMKNGRCRMHGGKSLCGKKHGQYKNGNYTNEALEKRQEVRYLIRSIRGLMGRRR